MDTRHPKIWSSLPVVALGLMLVSDFASVSESVSTILSWASIVILLTFSGSYFWGQHRNPQKSGPG